MKEFFGPDGLLLKVLNKTGDLIILNIVFLVTCIPIVTIGSALSAMYTVTLKMCKDEESYIVRGYFKAFKANFKQASIVYVIMLLAGIVIYLDFFYIQYFPDGIGKVLQVFFVALAIVFLMVNSYIFPLIAKFEYKLKMYFVNALFLSMRHVLVAIPITLINCIPLICLWHGGKALVYGITAYMIIGFALGALMNSYFLTIVFDKYVRKMKENANRDEDSYWTQEETIESEN